MIKPRKGGVRYKGQGAFYNEAKKNVAFTLTPTGVKGLDEIASKMELSRSELVEQIGRKIIPVSSESERLGEKKAS